VQALVARAWGVTFEEIMSVSRKSHVVRARQICFVFMRHFLRASYPGIGRAFGGRDHTTVLHGYNAQSEALFVLMAEIFASHPEMDERALMAPVFGKPAK
jgi:chromosomal replication initiator protein